jgi:hypothetical protein
VSRKETLMEHDFDERPRLIAMIIGRMKKSRPAAPV